MTEDLFPDLPVPKNARGKVYKRLAYPAAPGSGPDDKQCRHCGHCYRQGGARVYTKCGLMSGSRSANSDISMYSPACSYFREAGEEEPVTPPDGGEGSS